MKRFRYSLEAVRTVREHRERAAIEEYGRAAMAHRQAMAFLAQEERCLEALRAEIQVQAANGIGGAEFARMREGYQALEVRRRRQEELVARTLSTLTRATENCTKARQDREVVEKHYHQRKARHAHHQRVEDLKFLDELGSRTSSLPDFSMSSALVGEEAYR